MVGGHNSCTRYLYGKWDSDSNKLYRTYAAKPTGPYNSRINELPAELEEARESEDTSPVSMDEREAPRVMPRVHRRPGRPKICFFLLKVTDKISYMRMRNNVRVRRNVISVQVCAKDSFESSYFGHCALLFDELVLCAFSTIEQKHVSFHTRSVLERDRQRGHVARTRGNTRASTLCVCVCVCVSEREKEREWLDIGTK